jgi:ribonuclease BN (tRNA processing enzyme)
MFPRLFPTHDPHRGHANGTGPVPRDMAAACGCSTSATSDRGLSCRAILAGGAAAALGLALHRKLPALAETAPDAARAPQLDLSGTSVVLLGTAAGPVPQWPRNMNSQALIVDGHSYVVDCGNGIVRQIVDAGIPYETITNFFITHLHPDHVFDYLPAITCSRSIGPQPGFRTVVNTYGRGRADALPTGTPAPGTQPIDPALPTPGLVDTHNGLLDANAYWMSPIYIPPTRTFPRMPEDIRDLVIPHDIPTPSVGANPATGPYAPAMQPFAVFEDSRVKVSAILVDHPPVFPAYAYRFDTDNGSVVFSGDTTYCDNVITLAAGSDLLVHEAGNEKAMVAHGTPPELAKQLLNSHTDVTQVGGIAAGAQVKALALTHLISQNPLVAYPPPIVDGDWIAPIRNQYTGPVYVGRDLMRSRLREGGAALV